MKEKVVLWRWDVPTSRFEPVINWYIKNDSISLKNYDKVVYAGLNPRDWMDIKAEPNRVLHKIVLTQEKAKLCVVAEGSFKPTDEELIGFIKERNIELVSSLTRYEQENYEKSFVPFLNYSGGYNLPEVLIPFAVDAKICWFYTFYLKYMNWLGVFKHQFGKVE